MIQKTIDIETRDRIKNMIEGADALIVCTVKQRNNEEVTCEMGVCGSQGDLLSAFETIVDGMKDECPDIYAQFLVHGVMKLTINKQIPDSSKN